MTKKKKKNGVIGKLISIVCLSIAVILFLNIGKQVLLMVDLRRQKALVEEELQSLKEENETLTSTKTKLEDPNYVQTYARGEYMFSKNDEKVFYLPSNSQNQGD